jgi:mRNA interferase MazF
LDGSRWKARSNCKIQALCAIAFCQAVPKRRSQVVTVVVGTKGENIQRDYPTNVRVSLAQSGLPIETVFLCFQIRSLDPRRFPEQPVGRLSEQAMSRIEATTCHCLGL